MTEQRRGPGRPIGTNSNSLTKRKIEVAEAYLEFGAIKASKITGTSRQNVYKALEDLNRNIEEYAIIARNFLRLERKLRSRKSK